jgi:sugar/nucleoside kinase (ribokinase family)
MKRDRYKVCGVGNAIVDVFVNAEDSHLDELQLEKGSMRLVEHPEQNQLLKSLGGAIKGRVSGGSVANSVVAFAQLGGDAALIAAVGDDDLGAFYVQECEEIGISFYGTAHSQGVTGTCLSIITPDAERTMRTCLASSALLGASHIKDEVIAKSDWIFLEGYPLTNPSHGQQATTRALSAAKKAGAKLAFTCSESWVISSQRAAVMDAVQSSDLIFANELEAITLTETDSLDAALRAIKNLVPAAAVTLGPKGAWVWFGGEESMVPSPSVVPVDLTGAGDMFAGSFLFGITHELSAKESARRACFMATRVITQIGARLADGARVHWEELLRRDS